MTEPHAGSDVQAIRTPAVRDGDDYVVNGQKMWVTNGLRAGIVMLLAVTDPSAEPRHRGMTTFIVEKEPEVSDLPGLTVPPPQEARLPGRRVHRARLRGLPDVPRRASSAAPTRPASGFKQFMAGIELGRVNVAARGARHRGAGARERDPLRAGARGVRQADRPAPADPGQDRADGDEDPRGASC